MIIRYNETDFRRKKTLFRDNKPLSEYPSNFVKYETKTSEGDLNITLNVLCDSPKTLSVPNFLSDAEAEHIIDVGKYMGLKRSTVGSEALHIADRTSETTWLVREMSPIIDDIHARIADVARIDARLIYSNTSSESLQLVHYNEGQLYKPHWDYDTENQFYWPNLRFLTFLNYLNDVKEGGNTSFPRCARRCADSKRYFGGNPGKGNSVFFYGLLEDGNVDENSLHYAEPPLNGSEKWMSNLWIWDPVYPLHAKLTRG